MGEQYDVAVIGAGIVGVSTALHLLMRGKKVVMIDRREPGRETSFGNAGIIGNAYILPFGFPPLGHLLNIALDRDIAARARFADLPRSLPWIADFYLQSRAKTRRRHSLELWPLQANSIEEHRTLMHNANAERYLSQGGRVVLYRSEASFTADAFERDVARELGVQFDVVEMEAFHSIEPHIRPIYRKAVVWKQSARINNPGALVAAYAAGFTRDGGTFLQTEVSGLNAANGWSVRTAQGSVEAREIVICAGPWAMEILKPLGYRFPLGFKRGYHRHFKAMGSATLSHAILDHDKGYLIIPMEQGYRLTTGVEFAGLHAPPTPVQIDRALPYARELFPLGEPADAAPWYGTRPCFADSLPIVDAAPRHPGLWFSIGQGHFGLTIGPSTGRLLAEMMTGTKPFCDPTPYRAGRFSC